MLQRLRKLREESESGFTLIELLVVVLIIAILAAIAVPVFLRQRERGWEAQAQSAAKNGATAAESYGTEQNGNYGGFDGATLQMLKDNGFSPTADVTMSVEASANRYCIQANHQLLSDNWKYDSSIGKPEKGDCPALSPAP